MKVVVVSLTCSCCAIVLWVIEFALVPWRSVESNALLDLYRLATLISTVGSLILAIAAITMNIPKYMKAFVGIAGVIPFALFVIAIVLTIRMVAS